MFVRRDGVAAWPHGRVLYDSAPPVPPADEARWPAALRAAETLELRNRDYTAASAAYRAMLVQAGSNSPLHLAVQQRLARSLRKAGRATEALAVLEQIIDAHQSNGSPAVAAAWYDRCALIEETGRHQDLQTCAVGLYGGLVDGRWRLEKPLYEFYADGARRWTQPLAGRADVARLMAREASQLAVTRAAQAALQAWRAERRRELAGHLIVTTGASPILVAWRSAGQDESLLLVLGPAAATTQVFAPLVAKYAFGHAVSIATNRVVVFPLSGGEAGRAATADASTTAIQDAAAITRSKVGGLGVSPDGSQLAFTLIEMVPPPATRKLMVMPAAGGPARTVATLPAAGSATVNWTPDGRSVVFASRAPQELLLCDVTTGVVTKLTLAPEEVQEIAVSPSGREIAYIGGPKAKDDGVWMLENFLPKPKAPTPPAKTRR